MTDGEIIALLDSDPSEGIRQLIDGYSPLVYTVAYSKLGNVFSADDIEEFVSFIFSRIYERRSEIDFSRGSLKGYITTVARRMCIDEYRKHLSRVSTTPMTDEIAEWTPDSLDVQREAERTADERALTAALLKLGRKDRLILVRRYYFDQTSVQIAAELHMSDAAVRKRMSRALEKLRKMLSANGFTHY